MYTIYCIEMSDQVVKNALDVLTNDRQSLLPHTHQNYVLVTDNNVMTVGDGNPEVNIAVLLGHGSPNGVSGKPTFKYFNAELEASHRLQTPPRSIWVVSCGTAGNGSLFAYGNFAQSVKAAFPDSVVWASETNVNSGTFEGDWVQVQ